MEKSCQRIMPDFVRSDFVRERIERIATHQADEIRSICSKNPLTAFLTAGMFLPTAEQITSWVEVVQ